MNAPTTVPFDHVVIDNVAAASLATEHLLALGRRRIAAIGLWDPQAIGAPRMRLQGYLEALAAAGIAADPQLQVPAYQWHRASGAAAMHTLLALPQPPDAVFCFTDLLAVGAMSVLHQAGLRIPEDVAVVGFDDVDEALYTVPPLTTISPDKAAIGRVAVQLLTQRIAGTRTARRNDLTSLRPRRAPEHGWGTAPLAVAGDWLILAHGVSRRKVGVPDVAYPAPSASPMRPRCLDRPCGTLGLCL